MDDLKLIKKYYGEDMMHLCRKVFPTILECPGLLFSIIESNFAHNKFLYSDLINQDMVQGFKNYIYSFTEFKTAEAKTDKTPSELLDEADYVLYECKTDEEIQAFKKYYVFDEEICTFFEDRLSDCYVFFAVKKNVDEIKRENFKLPKRQDEYGVSVISIQFTKGDLNVLSIKNRYNHSVNNPDATYSNNLENIIPGLTYSFEKQYGLNINSNYKGNFELENYVLAKDNKLYKYNYNIGSYYYCPNNIIIDNLGNILTNYVEKEKYIVMDYFILDIVNKKIFTHDPKINDSLNDTFKNIKKIDIRNNKEKNTRIIEIILEDNTSLFIEIDSKNQIIGYVNNHIKSIEDNFLVFNKTLRYISLPQVAKIGSNFLSENLALMSLNFPNLKEVEDNFLYSNIYLNSFEAQNLEKVGNEFLHSNGNLISLVLPNLIKLGDNALYKNNSIINLVIPNITFMTYAFPNNIVLENLYAPRLRFISRSFLSKHPNRKNIIKKKKDLSESNKKVM